MNSPLLLEGTIIPLNKINANGWGIREDEVDNILNSIKNAVVRICDRTGENEHWCDFAGDRKSEIGRVLEAWFNPVTKTIDGIIAVYDRIAKQKIEDGIYPNKWSIFGQFKEKDGDWLKGVEISSLTLVENPAWEEAGFRIASSENESNCFYFIYGGEKVGVVPQHRWKYGKEDSAQWSKPALKDFTDKTWDELTDDEKKSIAAHYAWAAEMPPKTFGDLKLPHHDPKNHDVIWNGVRAAMAALLGARGGVDIPESDKKKVYDHLAAHYKEFGKEPPEFKMGGCDMVEEKEKDFEKIVAEKEKEIKELKKVVAEKEKVIEEMEEKLKKITASAEQKITLEEAEKLAEKIAAAKLEEYKKTVEKENAVNKLKAAREKLGLSTDIDVSGLDINEINKMVTELEELYDKFKASKEKPVYAENTETSGLTVGKFNFEKGEWEV